MLYYSCKKGVIKDMKKGIYKKLKIKLDKKSKIVYNKDVKREVKKMAQDIYNYVQYK